MALTDNPMSIIVTGNVTIGASLEASIPTTETYLVNENVGMGDYLSKTVSITIPNGVNVLYIYSFAESTEGYDDYVSVEIINTSNNKVWRYKQEGYSFYDQWYVGVTPGKTYTISLNLGAEYNLSAGELKISYSQAINQKNPSVTDY